MTPEQIEVEGMRLVAPEAIAPPCDICDDSGEWCKYCNPSSSFDNRPLLAQCAALLDSLLGGPVVVNGILDEIRRVRAELAKEGW